MVEMGVITNAIGAITNATVQAHNQALMSIQYISTPQPAQFAGNDFSALLPNQYTASIVTALQNPAWLPAVSFAPQTALFAGIDVGSLRPDTSWTQILTDIQAPTWIPSTLIPQPALFAGSDIYALYPNIETIINLTALQPPEWLPTVFIPQASLFAGMDVAALLANQIALQSQLDTANLTVETIEEDILVRKWWNRFPLQFFISVTEALGAVTESVVATKISATIFFIVNKVTAIVDQW